jgi:hypothetical protein
MSIDDLCHLAVHIGARVAPACGEHHHERSVVPQFIGGDGRPIEQIHGEVRCRDSAFWWLPEGDTLWQWSRKVDGAPRRLAIVAAPAGIGARATGHQDRDHERQQNQASRRACLLHVVFQWSRPVDPAAE